MIFWQQTTMLQQTAVTKPLPVKENERVFWDKNGTK